MADDLTALENWAAPLLAKLRPDQVRTLTRDIARELRRSQSQRIAKQQAPDGAAYAARKPQNTARRLRKQQGQIKQAMFSKLRTARHLRADSNAAEVTVGFSGRAAHIATVHQEGLRDLVKPGGPSYTYPARQLLGLTATERATIADQLLKHLG
jgi:phage virion morphogenesis protein